MVKGLEEHQSFKVQWEEGQRETWLFQVLLSVLFKFSQRECIHTIC